jgi:anti-sigma regulatory factor (Ser/Thr protein kinase)
MHALSSASGEPPATGARAGTAPPWQATPAGLRSEWRLESIASSVTAVRWWLRAFLGQAWGLGRDEIDDLLLAVCEAASNAVQHPEQPTEPFFDVCTEIDRGAVTVVIRDYGRWREAVSPRGRGLSLMHALAHTTVTPGAGGTTVTIRHLPEAPGPGLSG